MELNEFKQWAAMNGFAMIEESAGDGWATFVAPSGTVLEMYVDHQGRLCGHNPTTLDDQ